jgi:perosamine synthetase
MKNKIKFKIPVANPTVGKEEAEAVYKKINSGWISMGPEVHLFENKVKSFLKVKNAVAMNNGTSALDSILTALNIKQNDEVIVPSLTYISTANVVSYKKAKLVLCDSDEDTFNVNIKSLEKKITKKTKLIIVTDMKGMPVEYDVLKKLSKKNNIPIISDSAESFGAKYKNKKIGSQLLAHTFSFFANKNLTTGEGGMVVTNNDKLAKKLRIIRNQGQNKRYNHILLGNNYRMTDTSAAMGIVQLKKLPKALRKKQIIANRYNDYFSGLNQVTVPRVPYFVTQHSWYNYSIKVSSRYRNKLIRYLDEKKIETRLSFPPIHVQPYYEKKFIKEKKYLKKSSKTYSEFLDIPIWADLKKKDQLYVITTIKNFFKKK